MKLPPDCTCKICVAACRTKPGLFAPGEAEKAAKLLGLTLQQFFDKHLMVDYWTKGADVSHFTLSPAIKEGEPGELFDRDPRGHCVFLKDARCSIHAAKPIECKAAHHDCSRDQVERMHKQVALQWNTKQHQAQIKKLRGKRGLDAPANPGYGLMDMIMSSWR